MKYRQVDLEKIKQISIIDYARTLGFTPVKIGRRYYTLKEHDSVRIDPEKNFFFRNSTGERGSVIDFVSCFCSCDFKEAVRILSESEYAPQEKRKENSNVSEQRNMPKESKELILPKAADTMKNVFAYLCKSRMIDSSIVQEMVDRRMLYQDIRNNCVFVSGNEEGKPCFASLRGTNTYKRFVADCPGCDYERCFFIGNGSRNLVVTESVIDAMSMMNLFKQSGRDYKQFDYLALSGTGKFERPIIHHLSQHEYGSVFLCLDNDEAGKDAAAKIESEIGLSFPSAQVVQCFPKTGKDFNDVLKASKSVKKNKEMEAEL